MTDSHTYIIAGIICLAVVLLSFNTIPIGTTSATCWLPEGCGNGTKITPTPTGNCSGVVCAEYIQPPPSYYENCAIVGGNIVVTKQNNGCCNGPAICVTPTPMPNATLQCDNNATMINGTCVCNVGYVFTDVNMGSWTARYCLAQPTPTPIVTATPINTPTPTITPTPSPTPLPIATPYQLPTSPMSIDEMISRVVNNFNQLLCWIGIGVCHG